MKQLICLSLLLVFLAACSKNEPAITGTPLDEPDLAFSRLVAPYLNLEETPVPFGFPSENDNSKATLGRVLFYDKNLSADGKISCASCHKQEFAFGDNVAFSEGVFGGRTERNSIALGIYPFEPRYGLSDLANFFDAINFSNQGLFWDKRATNLTAQCRATFANEVEMGMNVYQVLQAAKQRDFYPWLFEKAFGDPEITELRIMQSLSMFLRSMKNNLSRFDQSVKAAGTNDFWSKDFPTFTKEENLGKFLFTKHCVTCHTTSLNQQVLFTSADNGLEQGEKPDAGIGGHTKKVQDFGVFKSPPLRNIAVTAPYMHDGRFQTLDEVIEHYNSGIHKNPNLHPILRVSWDSDADPIRMNLTEADKKALKKFLETLTDWDFLSDEKFKDPFR
ncbi:MAG TPA: cytochrome c peroxidase [Saprospiraceae bacterium]|nr:cytochrome c peroxidase [Saprospiraceae bacterium]